MLRVFNLSNDHELDPKSINRSNDNIALTLQKKNEVTGEPLSGMAILSPMSQILQDLRPESEGMQKVGKAQGCMSTEAGQRVNESI